MGDFAQLNLKPQVLAEFDLPDIAYPLPSGEWLTAMNAGELPFAMMLSGLQQYCSEGQIDWQHYEHAMDRLAELVAPDDDRQVVTAAGDTWWLEIGTTGLDGELVAIQRGTTVISIIRPRDDGRLRVATFRPLDAKSADYLISLSVRPHPDHGVCIRPDNWAYALDCAASNGNSYAADRDEAYLAYWKRGLGVGHDGAQLVEWDEQRNLVARRPALVAAELGVHHGR